MQGEMRRDKEKEAGREGGGGGSGGEEEEEGEEGLLTAYNK